MAVGRRPSGAGVVFQAAHAHLRVALAPHRHLVVVHVHQLADFNVGVTFGSKQHDPRPLREPRLDRVRSHQLLQIDPVRLAYRQ